MRRSIRSGLRRDWRRKLLRFVLSFLSIGTTRFAHPNMGVRTQALMGLRRMATAAKAAVPALLDDLNDDDRIYRADVKATLDTIAESDAKLLRIILLATNEASAVEACMQAA